MLIVLFLVSHFNFLFVLCGRLSWLPVSFLLHVKYILLYRIVLLQHNQQVPPQHMEICGVPVGVSYNLAERH